MSMRTRAGVMLLLLGLGLPAAEAMAQPQKGPEGRGRGEADGPPLAPAEVLNLLDAYALVQAQNTLRLTDAQYGPFVTQLRALQQTRRRNMQARNAIVQELRRLTGPQVSQVDETAVRERLTRLRDLEQRAAAELHKAYEALDGTLDVRQQARFRIFEEMLERRKLDLLMRARRGAAQRR